LIIVQVVLLGAAFNPLPIMVERQVVMSNKTALTLPVVMVDFTFNPIAMKVA